MGEKLVERIRWWEEYTARNGGEGSAVCLISPEDGLKWRDIHKLLYPGEPLPHIPHVPGGNKRGGGYKGKKPHGGNAGGGHQGKPGGSHGGGGNNRFKPRFPRRSGGPSASKVA